MAEIEIEMGRRFRCLGLGPNPKVEEEIKPIRASSVVASEIIETTVP